jgi:hypothetical protein
MTGYVLGRLSFSPSVNKNLQSDNSQLVFELN